MRSATALRKGRSARVGNSRRLKLETLEPRMLLTGSIQGVKWLDLDVDGMRDPDEPGIADWTIYLRGDPIGTHDEGRWVTQTNEKGEYVFGEVPDGVYTVSEELPDGWAQTFPGPRVELRDIETYRVGHGEAKEFQFVTAAIREHYDDPSQIGRRLAVDSTVEVVWPDWSWNLQPDRTDVSVEGNRIELAIYGRNSEVHPTHEGLRTERLVVSLPPLEPGQYTMAATLFEDNILYMGPTPLPSLGTSAALRLGAAGTYIVEVPGDPTFAPRHFDFGNIRHEHPRGPHIVAHEPSGEIPEAVHEVVVKFNQPINSETFTPEDVNVMVGVLDIAVPVFEVAPVDDLTYLIKFGGPDVAMDYHVYVGPHVENLRGIEMDQDRDGRPGEAHEDVYDAGFVVVERSAPRVARQWPAPDTTERLVSSIRVHFNEPMDPATINQETFWLAGNIGREDPGLDALWEKRIDGKVQYDETTWTATFITHADRLPRGTYVVVLTDGITDEQGLALDGEWLGDFPSGDGEPGGHYLTLFDVGVEDGTIVGAKWNDRNGNGIWEDRESGLPGWTIYLDEDRDGQFDPPIHDVTKVIEADEYRVGEPIVDPSGVATLYETIHNRHVLAVPNEHVNTAGRLENVFGTRGDDSTRFLNTWSQKEAVLRVKFARPVNEASLLFTGTGLRGGYQGIIRAYDAAGELLVAKRTEVIWGSGSETLIVSTHGNDIAYIEATGSSDWIPVMIDHLKYAGVGQPGEPHTRTDRDGEYAFAGLEPGTYVVGEVPQVGWRQTYPRRQANFIETFSHQVGEGGALDFAISEVTIGLDSTNPDHTQRLGVDITLDVLWQDTSYALLPHSTRVSVEGDQIIIELMGESSGGGADVLWTESTTIHVPGIQPGEYTISATLNESAGPMLPAFWPIWQTEAKMTVNSGRQHIVTLEAGDSIEDIDFGNRRAPWVLRRRILYSNSAFDHGTGGWHSDDAIAPDPDSASAPHLGKTALLPGQDPSSPNYTNYDRGINGLVIDIGGLPGETLRATGDPDTSDFEFRIRGNDDPNRWRSSFDTSDPVSLPTVSVREDIDGTGVDRVMLVWDDFAIRNTWLEVRVKANANTGLEADDVFYFGNVVGDANGDGVVDLSDFNIWNAAKFTKVGIESPADFDRSGTVDLSDFNIWNAHKFTGLAMPPEPAPPAAVEQVLDDSSTLIGELVWLQEQQNSRQEKTSDAATLAVDRLLATYWQ